MNKMTQRYNYLRYFLKNSFSALSYKLFHKWRKLNTFRGQKNITIEYSNNLIEKLIESNAPFALARFGSVELSCVNNYRKIELGFKRKYKKSVIFSIKNNAGVFPTTDIALNEFSKIYLNSFLNIDVLGIYGTHMEDYFQRYYASQVKIAQYFAFEPLIGHWTHLLKGKKVLVISPFSEEIESQYKIKDKILPKEILPDFASLSTIKAVQTLAQENDERFSSWSEALDYMKKEIDKKDFDIALVGAGAYGLPLVTYIKEIGKQAIQTGGATQTLFGIMGKRWENRSHVSKYVNEFWIRPRYTPKGISKIDKGAYW